MKLYTVGHVMNNKKLILFDKYIYLKWINKEKLTYILAVGTILKMLIEVGNGNNFCKQSLIWIFCVKN